MSAARWSMDWERLDPLEYGLYDNPDGELEAMRAEALEFHRGECEMARREAEEELERERLAALDALAVGFTAFRPDVLLVWRRLLGLEG